MKAVFLHGYGGVDQLVYEDAPEPKPQAGEVLVKVAATSVNPVDWKIRRGDHRDTIPLRLPAILGHDLAGTVVSTGANVHGFRPGDAVMGVVSHTYAEFLVTTPEALTHIPDGLDMEDAAALPLVLTTGAQLIESGVQPKAGQTLLVTGAVGGVGRTAVYVAKLHGMRVLAGVRTKQLQAAEALRADRVVAIDDVRGIASLEQVDAIADTIGDSVILKLMPHLRDNGVLATVRGKPKGSDERRFRVQEVWAVSDPGRLQHLAQAVASGSLSIPIGARMKLSQVREAHTLAEAGGIGKVLLLP